MRRALAGLVLAILWGSAVSAATIFPRAVLGAGASTTVPSRFDPEPLWVAGAANGYRQRIRMFIGGNTRQSWAIELSERRNGSVTGVVAEHDGRHVVHERNFRVSRKDFEALQVLIGDAKLWTIFPEFWQSPIEGEVCVDGELVTLERLDAAGYRFSEGNAQCDLGRRQLLVLAKMFELAGEPGLKSLLN